MALATQQYESGKVLTMAPARVPDMYQMWESVRALVMLHGMVAAMDHT